MANHYMVDIETMDTAVTSAIVSIGIVEFNPYADGLWKWEKIDVSLESCLGIGLTVSASTILWWMEQSEEARLEICRTDRLPIRVALTRLHDFVDYSNDRRVWFHGPAFDAAILENAHLQCGMSMPWSFRDYRDTRTLYNLAKVSLNDYRKGTKHSAVDDAISQAMAVQAAYAKLRISADEQPSPSPTSEIHPPS